MGRAICQLALFLVVAVAGVGTSHAAGATDGIQLLQPTVPTEAHRRLALVIGNGAYTNVPRLKNTVQDADSVSTKLRGLGYSVEYAQNVDRRSMNEAITGFLARIEPGMEAMVYYAGHGVELNGANFLLSTDVPALAPDQERMLRTEGINVNDLLLDITDRRASVTLVILDACRDNPFHSAGTYGSYRSLGTTRGLAMVSPPRGSFVIFSAGAGEKALDNLGSADTDPNGLFTRKLLALMDKDGLEIHELVRELRVEVSEAAASTADRHSQVPGYYDQMIGDFYFRPKVAALSPTVLEPAPPLHSPPPPAPAPVETVEPQPAPAPPALARVAPQRVANLPPYSAPPPAVAFCRAGEERRNGMCQALRCAEGLRRDKGGRCMRVVPFGARARRLQVPPRPRALATLTRHVGSARCFLFNNKRVCD